MNGSTSRPRKRNAQQMTMFKRALFALNKNETNHKAVSPPCKRPRIVSCAESKEAKDSNFTPFNASPTRNNHRMKRHYRDAPKSFNTKSFNKPPPQSPTHSFLHDRSRNYNNETRSKYIRHTPNTRLFTNDTHQHHQHQHHHHHAHNRNYNYNHRKHREQNHYYNRNKEQSYNNSTYKKANQHQNNVSYHVVEQCRMKKLWTDFHGDEEHILNELKFCRDTSFFITSNSIAHKISVIIKLLFTHYSDIDINESDIHILDGLACIGGNSYSFAKIFSSIKHNIYCNELDAERCNALKHNMNVFEHYGIINNNAQKTRFAFHNLDFLQLHKTLGAQICNKMDVVFLDPEWNNGDDYKQTNRGEIHLFDIGELHLYQVVDRIVSEWYPNIKIIAIKLAKNYDQEFIHRKLQKCKLIETKIFRVGQISFHNQKLMLIVRSFGNKAADAAHDKSFEEIFHDLPKLTNKNNPAHDRDIITVKLLS